MGIGIVLLAWAIGGTVLAGIGALLVGKAAEVLTRGAVEGRRRVIFAARLFPLICFVWAGIVFVFQAVVNESVLHRDAGLGDTLKCPLPNGYALLMIDVTDEGIVYNPKTQSGDTVGEQEDAVQGVRKVQVAARYIFGAADSKWFDHSLVTTDAVDVFFVLDTLTGKQTRFSTYQGLASEAERLGIQPGLVTINDVYSEYRFTKFDVFIGFLVCLPPLGLALLLVWWILNVRRHRQLTIQTV